MYIPVSMRWNFNGSGTSDKSKALKRKRKATNRKTGEKALKKGSEFHITPELQALHDSGKIHELDKSGTEELKGWCELNGILKGGPKYGLVARLREHAALSVKKTKKAGLADKVSTGDAGSAVELKISNFKSFEAAYKCVQKEVANMAKAKTAEGKFVLLKVGCVLFCLRKYVK
jgi:hypothetical protein